MAAAVALASHFFDTMPVPPPFEDHPLSEKHPLRTLRVSTFPSDLFLFVRAVRIVKALSDQTTMTRPPGSTTVAATASPSVPPHVATEWSLAESWREHALGCLHERELQRKREARHEAREARRAERKRRR